MRDDGCVAPDDPPSWISAAIPAAVRLAAEAGTEVDEVLAHPRKDAAAADRLAQHAAAFEHSAGLTEVATDLAGLLWAECGEVPLIATIVQEPAARAALEAVAEARRLSGRRLAEEAAICSTRTAHAHRPPDARPGSSQSVGWAALLADTPAPAVAVPVTPVTAATEATEAATVQPAPPAPPAPATAPPAPPAPTTAPAGSPSRAQPPVTPPTPRILAASAAGTRRSATGALVAGAAATAILLFGRHLRRA